MAVTAVFDSLSYADILAYVVAVLVTVATLGALWLLDRCTLRTCAVWALVLAAPVASLTWSPTGDEVRMERIEAQPFDTTGIEDGAAWGGVVLFSQWWEASS